MLHYLNRGWALCRCNRKVFTIHYRTRLNPIRFGLAAAIDLVLAIALLRRRVVARAPGRALRVLPIQDRYFVAILPFKPFYDANRFSGYVSKQTHIIEVVLSTFLDMFHCIID